NSKPHPLKWGLEIKKREFLLRMKFTIILLTLFVLQSYARVDAQVLSLNVKDADLKEVLSEIRRQTGYSFAIGPRLQRDARKVTLYIANAPFKAVLTQVFSQQPFDFEIRDKTVLVRRKPTPQVDDNKLATTPPYL